MIWKMLHPQMTLEMLGHIPSFINENDPRPAVEQLDSNYRHGGGWSSFPGFTMLPNGNLQYSGDPPVRLLAKHQLAQRSGAFLRSLLGSYYPTRRDL